MLDIKELATATLVAATIGLGSAQPAGAIQLLVNGGFETGDFTGWSVVNAGEGDFFVTSSPTLPISLLDTVGPANGNFYAVSDQSGPGTHALLQAFTVAPGTISVVLSFRMFVNNIAILPIVDPAGLDHEVTENQHGRVDLLAGSASAFNTGAGVLRNFYVGSDLGTNPSQYIDYIFDITAQTAAGGTFQIRFAETDNQGPLNLGVDDVSIIASTEVPAPASLAMLAFGAGLVASSRRRRR